MSRFNAILLPLDGSPEAAKAADCALWLAQALGATLHVLHATAHSHPAQDALARLRVPHVQDARVVVHQLSGAPEVAVLEQITAHRVDLVVMSACGESVFEDIAPSHRLGAVARAVIERSPVPVVLLPLHYRQTLPWSSMLAAASGEAAADQALKAAAHIAAALQIKVIVVHAGDGPAEPGRATLGAYLDAPHHEVPQRLEQLVERGLAGCGAEEARCVQQVLLCRGDPAEVLLEQAARHDSGALALGCHGALGAGRALVLKRLTEEAECALLLVRGTEHARARLRVGQAIDAD